MKANIGQSSRAAPASLKNLQCACTEQCVLKTHRPKQVLFPRRKLVTSVSQAVIATSLAISILTFVFSLAELLPMR